MLGRGWRWALVVTVFALAGAGAGCGDGGTGDPVDGGGGLDAARSDGGGGDTDGGGDDGGGASDGGGTSDGGAGVTCGPTTCAVGEVCCNESCGICTPPGGSCIEIACADDAGPGGDAGGGGSTCGGIAGLTCAASEWCDYESCAILDGTGVCRPRPSGCPRLWDPVCGCDGVTYANDCVANASGADVASRGECATADVCEPDDARAVGSCDAIVGIAWNGTMCVQLSGCSCEGTDCGRYPDLAACMTLHRSCATTARTFACGDAMTCARGAQYCRVLVAGPSGSMPSYSCLPLPERCATRDTPTCATCFPGGAGGGGDCRDDGMGAINVMVFAP